MTDTGRFVLFSVWRSNTGGVHAGVSVSAECLPSAPSGSALPGEEVPQGVVVVLVEGGVYEWVKEGVGVAQPQEDALPDGRDVAGAQRNDELGDEEGYPAKHEDADQNAHHQRRLLLLLLAPRVPVRLEGHGGVAHSEHHLGLLRFLLHLGGRRSENKSITPLIHESIKPG